MKSPQRWLGPWMLAALTTWGWSNPVFADTLFCQHGIDAIHQTYGDLGGRAGVLRTPVSEPRATASMPGVFQDFDGGSLYGSPTTEAHAVHGAMRAKGAELGWARSRVGDPGTDERINPDGVGRRQPFQYGQIYWHPATGAHGILHRPFWEVWSTLGGEQGALGYPIADAYSDRSCGAEGRRNDFEGGVICWTPSGGPVVAYRSEERIQAISLHGDTWCPYGAADCNRCVQNVEAAVDNLTDSGDQLGFYLGAGHPGLQNKVMGADDHWQGIQRLSGANNPFFIVTSNQADHARLSVVAMASRDASGFRLRSNKLAPNQPDWRNAPPRGDRIVQSVALTRQSHHPGGISVLGQKVIVPYVGYQPLGQPHTMAALDIVDVSDPYRPRSEGVLTYDGKEAHFATAAKLADGRYLMMGGTCHAERSCDRGRNLNLFFFLSRGGALTFNKDEGFFWNARQAVAGAQNWLPMLTVAGLTTDVVAYQNMNLITECHTGQLYLMGTSEDKAHAQGWLHVFKANIMVPATHITDIRLTVVRKKRVYCQGQLDGHGCNLHAAGGVYVDPEGSLYLYATEHFNDGPANSVRMREFRPKFPVTTGCTEDNGWVALFRDRDFTGVHMMIDLVDRDRRDYRSFTHAYNFDNQTSSLAWCAPAGSRIVLYNDPYYRGRPFAVQGTGTLESIPVLENAWDDTFSSFQFWR